MKHTAVESLVRNQFNIPDTVEVKVKFLDSYNDSYEYEVEWWGDGDLRNQCNLRLPHITYSTQVFK